MNKFIGSILLVACGTPAGCGGEVSSLPAEQDYAQSEWRLVEGEYPYEGEDGQTVCARYERPGPKGLSFATTEFYYFDRINAQLAESRAAGGTEVLPYNAASELDRQGIERVATCEEAQEFVRLKTEARGAVGAVVAKEDPSEERVMTERPGQAPEGPDLTDKIFNGYAYSDLQTAYAWIWTTDGTMISPCSASVASTRAVILAAHCGLGASGWVKATIRNFAGGCLIGGNCDSAPVAVTAYFAQHPNYTGTGDVSDDIGILGSGVNFSGSYNRIRLMVAGTYAGTPAWLEGFGYSDNNGNGLGTLRLSNYDQTIDAVNSSYFRFDYDPDRGVPCKMDSGGPAISTGLFNYNLSMGVASQGDNVDPFCPTGDFRYTRHKKSWIQELHEDMTGISCTEYWGGGDLDYLRCW